MNPLNSGLPEKSVQVLEKMVAVSQLWNRNVAINCTHGFNDSLSFSSPSTYTSFQSICDERNSEMRSINEKLQEMNVQLKESKKDLSDEEIRVCASMAEHLVPQARC